MTTLKYDGETIAVNHDGHVTHFTPEHFYRLTPDQDVHEAAAIAIELRDTEVQIRSFARGQKPRNSQKYFVQ